MAFISFGMQAQDQLSDTLIQLKGYTVFAPDSSSISDVHVLNLSRGTGTVTSYDGSFLIRAQNNDTIKFSCIGYHDYFLSVNQNMLLKEMLIFLETDTVFMDEILISPLGPRRFFKYKFLETRVPGEKLNMTNLRFPRLKDDPAYTPEFGIRFMGPVQALYNAFNRSARLQRKLRKNREKYSKYLIPVVSDSLEYPGKKVP